MTNPGKIRRVAIIGTGIAGLGMGACLKQLRTGVEEIVIYERYGDIMTYNKGGALNISGGSVVLDLLGASTDLQKISNKVNHMVVSHDKQNLVNLDLTQMKDMFPSFMCEEGGKGDPMVYLLRWSMLRKLLHDVIVENKHKCLVDVSALTQGRERQAARHEEVEQDEEMKEIVPPVPLVKSSPMASPSITFQLNHNFSYLVEDHQTGKVTVFFEDGKSEGNFDLVIGADGVRSRVRDYTSLPNETIISRVPMIGKLLGSLAEGNHNTGLRVGQCITPLRGLLSSGKEATSKGERDLNVGFAGRDAKEREEMGDETGGESRGVKGKKKGKQGPDISKAMNQRSHGNSDASHDHNGDGESKKGERVTTSSPTSITGDESESHTAEDVDSILSGMKHHCSNELHLWIGDGTNVLTCNVGNGDTLHNVLLTVYRENQNALKSQNASWEQHDGDKTEIKTRLNESGFNNYHDLHILLDATSMTGGQIFDVGVRDTLFPLTTWTSDSGRVILIGDAAHTM
jgi:2-polyprenyl-6-methoxyphenol hydroxylase-like FAD-dependent oxidoreductase